MTTSRNHIRAVLGATLTFLAFSIFAQTPSGDYEVKGKAFRARIDAAFKAEPQFHRFLDVTDACNRAGLEGETVDEVTRLLQAAGQKGDLVKGFGPTLQPDDLVGGFGLVSGLTYGSAITIVLRAPFPAKNGERKIANVQQCLIVSTNL